MKKSNQLVQAFAIVIAAFGISLLLGAPSATQAQGTLDKYTTQTSFSGEGVWSDLSQSGSASMIGDQVDYSGYDYLTGSNVSTSLPFDFNYDNTVEPSGTSLTIGPGYITFGSMPLYDQDGGLGSSSYPGVMYIWGGAYTMDGSGEHNGDGVDATGYYGIYTETDGSPGNQVFTIQITGVHSGFGTGYAQFGSPSAQYVCSMQVKLFQASGIIQFIYQNHGQYLNTYTQYSPFYESAIGLNGLGSPSFESVTYGTALSNTPSTDLQFTPPLPPGQLSLQPKTINFGAAPVGFAQQATATASSVGVSPISITSYTLTGSSDFTLVSGPGPGTAMPVGNQVQYTFQFDPSASGSEFAKFTLVTTGKDSGTQVVNLEGNGLAPSVQFSTNALFHRTNVPLGDTSGVQYVGITNTGNYPLAVNSIYFIGLDAADYFISRYPASVIPPDVTDSVGIRFAPRIEGRPDASLVISTNALNTPWDTVSLFGAGTLERLVIDSAYSNRVTLNFDSVAVGVESCRQLLLVNPGSDTLKILKDFFASADYDFSFTRLNSTDSLIPPGDSEFVQVCFTPLKRGFRTADLQFITAIPPTFTTPPHDTSDFLVTFIGTGVPTGNFQITGPDQIDSTPIGTTVCQTDTLWNIGESDLTVTSLKLSGMNAAEFLPNLPTLPLLLAAGTHQIFTVCATLTGSGDQTATITGVATSTEKNDTTTLPLDVYGTSDSASAVLTGAFDAPTCVGGSSTGTITVTNMGNTTGNYSASLTNQSNAPDFQITGSTTSTEAPNGTATFTVTFTPTTNGTETATFTVSVGGNTVGTLALSAQGGEATIAGTGTAPVTDVNTTNSFAVPIQNTGTCPWTPGIPSFPNGSMFSYGGSGAATLIPAGQSGMMTFNFTPTSVGNFGPDAVTFPAAIGSSSSTTVTLNGTSQASGVANVSSSQGYSLEQNYPNPFGGKSEVEITLPESGMVQLVIVDLTGKVVQTVLDERLGAGTFQVTLDASGLASGTYYYQLMSGGVTLTRQMMVIK